MNNSVFSKTMENMRKHRDIKLVTIAEKKKVLAVRTKLSCKKKKKSENVLAIEMNKMQMNKPIYLSLSILELSKIVRYEFWYNYLKQNYAKWIQTALMSM